MRLEIYQVVDGEYSWRLKEKGREIARMPDGTASPSKIKRTVGALMHHARAFGSESEISAACLTALDVFEKQHPARKAVAN